jgi:mono/diheme cytochrome c family protein
MATENQKFLGLLAQFDDPDTLVHACDQARQAGYKAMDAYSPMPIHGIDPAIGIKRTILPFIVLFVGLNALFIGLFLQFYTNSADWSPIFPGYAFYISGKPIFSLPANIPVTFEIIVLSSAFATFFGMWILNKLPRFANPLHRISRFSRATNDRFFLMIEEKDDNFDRSGTETQLNEWGATAIEEVNEDMTDQKVPKVFKMIAVLGSLLLLVPPVMIFRSAGMTNRAPRLHVVPDMDWQDKRKTQTLGPTLANGESLFTNHRTMQGLIPGTLARGDLEIDTEYFGGFVAGDGTHGDDDHASATIDGASVRTGLGTQDDDETAAQEPAAETAEEPNWVTSFPEGVTVSQETLARGKARFEIYCSACHGYAGNGDGLVTKRAESLNATGKAAWTAAKSLHDPEVKKNAVGRIYDTITNGRGTMGPYKSQIPVEDRWAIVMYVKALQETGIEPVDPAATAETTE